MMVGFSAAASAMVQSPAFADASKYAGAADKKKAEKAAAELAKNGPQKTPYALIIEASGDKEAKEKAELKGLMNAAGTFSTSSKADGVTFRKPSDPNACSEVCAPGTRLPSFADAAS